MLLPLKNSKPIMTSSWTQGLSWQGFAMQVAQNIRNLANKILPAMSRLDYLTIGIIAVIVLAVLYLVYKMTDLFQSNALETPPPIEQPVTEPEYDYYDEPYDTLNQDTFPAEDDEIDYSEPAYDETSTVDDTPEYTYEDEQPLSDTDTEGEYFVLAGTFSIRENADRMVAQLQRLGYEQARVGIFNGGKFAGAIICCYPSPQAAREDAALLNAQGIEAVVYRKRGKK